MKKIIAFICVLIILSTITACSNTEKPLQKETTTDTKVEKEDVHVVFVKIDEENKIITWQENQYAESYHIKITSRMLDDRGHLRIDEGSYKKIEEKLNWEETFYDVSHLPKGFYQFEISANVDQTKYIPFVNHQNFFNID